MISGSQIFIADLHLDPANVATTELALRFFADVQGKEQLYILGDLFEYWLGDDAGIALYTPILNALRQVSDSGCPVSVMLGNRDFLLGEAFARYIGATLVSDDELLITIDQQPVLLMHGDTLCTDDTDYQRFRKNLRSPSWQKQFLAKAIDERRHQAEALRSASHEASSLKSMATMDVNTDTVLQRMQWQQVETLIHGHTHRPAVHRLEHGNRWVVGDWHNDHAQYVQWADGELKLMTYR